MSLKSMLFKDKPAKQDLTPLQVAEVKLVEDFHDTGLRARQGFEKQWYINMAYWMGKQWLSWNKTKRQLEVPLVPSYRVRMVINKIKGNVNHIVAKLVKSKPTYVALPATGEDSDLNKAEISGKVLKHLHRVNKMTILNQRVCQLKVIFGTSFKDSMFDSNKGVHKRKAKMITLTRAKYTDKGEEDGTEEYQGPKLNEETGEQEFYDIHTGEVVTEVLGPFSIIPESNASDLESSFRVMKVITKSVEYVRETYAEGQFVHADTRQPGSSLQKQLLRLLGQEEAPRTAMQMDKNDQNSADGFVTIKELREKPSKKYPQGRLIRVANGVLLDSGPLPFKFMINRQTFGLVRYVYTEVDSVFWGTTPTTDMIPIQTELNKTTSQIVEIKNLMSKPKWVIFKQNKLPKTSITSEPGEVLEVNYVEGVPAPSAISPPSIPAYVNRIIDRANLDMMDIASKHEVSSGGAPKGVKSGVAIQHLSEEDQTTFGPVISRFEVCEGEAGTYQLEIVKERYREKRLLKIVGENNSIEVFEFLAAEDMPTDVEVQSGSAFPQSLVAKQQLIIQQFKEGMMGNVEDPQVQRKALRLSEVGALDVVYEEAAADEREAEREHKIWESGAAAFIQFFDNHRVHGERHRMFCKSDRYRNLVTKEPLMAKVIEEHIEIHDTQDPMMISKQQQETLAKNQMGLENQLKGKDDSRKDLKAQDDHAVVTSQLLTDVKEREDGPPGLGGT